MAQPHSPEPTPDKQPSGLPLAIACYLLWGFFPLYFKELTHVPPLEILAQRIVWSMPICLVIMVFRRQIGEYLTGLRTWAMLRLLLASTFFIAANWLTYIHAIMADHVIAASLGYYLNPLVNVMLGVVFLKEKLTRLQALAVAVAALAVGLLLAGALDTLWISLTLAFSFGFYGLIRKLTQVGAVPGLAIETTVLFLPALCIVLWYGTTPGNPGFGADTKTTLMLMVGGVLTAIPLLMFAVAARRMSYVALGFVQFLAPSIIFLLGLFLYNEPLNYAQLGCFALIWTSIAIFSLDLWVQARARRMPVPA